MSNRLKFDVHAADDNVVVTLVGTRCMVRFRRGDSGLKLFHARGDDRAPIHDVHFLARARQLAEIKAKELGWVA